MPYQVEWSTLRACYHVYMIPSGMLGIPNIPKDGLAQLFNMFKVHSFYI